MEAEKAIDPQLKEILTKAGAEEYIPVFAKKGVGAKQVIYMNDKQLSEVHSYCVFSAYIALLNACPLQLGVHNAYLRQKIIAASEVEVKVPNKTVDSTPSAPAASEANDIPSAPPAPLETYQSNECVVCLENKVSHISFAFRHTKNLL